MDASWERVGGRRSKSPALESCVLSLEDWLKLTWSADPKVRKQAVREVCPCHLKLNQPEVWDRILELAKDPDAEVRKHVFHTLGDGSPRERETEVVAAIETMRNDPNLRLRRRVRKLLEAYRHGGRINLL